MQRKCKPNMIFWIVLTTLTSRQSQGHLHNVYICNPPPPPPPASTNPTSPSPSPSPNLQHAQLVYTGVQVFGNVLLLFPLYRRFIRRFAPPPPSTSPPHPPPPRHLSYGVRVILLLTCCFIISHARVKRDYGLIKYL